ncbi:MAG TPA: PriCT-2 domain-containing protein [Cellvibrionaceae bacterium]
MSDFEPTTLDDVREALGFVRDLAYVREDWVKIGNALKSEFGDSAFDVWLDWSSNYPKFKSSEARGVWKSLKFGKNSLGYLFRRAIASGYSRQKREFTAEEKKRFAVERAARLEAVAAQAHIDEQEELRWHEEIARVTCAILSNTKQLGPSAYLGKKRVGAYGLRFPLEPMLVLMDEQKAWLLKGDEVKAGFAEAKAKGLSVRFIRPGDVLMPLRDSADAVWNVQIINKAGKKLFLKNGRKAGLFHFIGNNPVEEPVVIVEGYSTGASIHMARGWPVVVAIDSGNLPPVAVTVRSIFPNDVIIICADDDRETEGNPGLTKATEAAGLIGAAVCIPNFGGVQRG